MTIKRITSALLPAFRVGVVGYSTQEFDKHLAFSLFKEWLEEFASHNGAENIEVISGLTDLGVPGVAYHSARELGIRTVGIACSKANEHELFPCDKVIIVGTEWGQESATFLARLTHLVRIGGGKQSLAEAQQFRDEHGTDNLIEWDL
jgi:hypothetical protein